MLYIVEALEFSECTRTLMLLLQTLELLSSIPLPRDILYIGDNTLFYFFDLANRCVLLFVHRSPTEAISCESLALGFQVHL